jgi:hypothetical protein
MFRSRLGLTTIAIMLLVVAASGVSAVSSEIVTTTDGRTIELRDDGTFRVLFIAGANSRTGRLPADDAGGRCA